MLRGKHTISSDLLLISIQMTNTHKWGKFQDVYLACN